jgi:hypothetical protein
MTATLAERLRAFLNPKHADAAALRALLDAVPPGECVVACRPRARPVPSVG